MTLFREAAQKNRTIMCLYTKYILNKKYMYTKKNQGNVPKCKDERLRYVPAKCGKCIECRKEKARNWRIRLAEELKKSPNALFITLTFNEENYQQLAWELFKKSKENLNYTEQNEMCKTAVRRWLERIRKKTKRSIKHWLVTEKGEDYGRIHLPVFNGFSRFFSDSFQPPPYNCLAHFVLFGIV